MTISASDLNAGIAALQAYVEGITWEAMFINAGVYQTGVTDIITSADDSADQTPAGRQTAAQSALRSAINAAGYGSEVTDQECHDGAAVVLAAVNKNRAAS